MKKKELIDLISLDYTTSDLMSYFNLSRSTIRYWLKKYNITDLNRPTNKNCVCEICNNNYIFDRSKSHTYKRCGSCYELIKKKRKKQKLLDLFGAQCNRCGYNEHPEILEFHHVDPENKMFTIGGNYNKSIDDLIIEAAKCEVLCCNCHRIEHLCRRVDKFLGD